MRQFCRIHKTVIYHTEDFLTKVISEIKISNKIKNVADHIKKKAYYLKFSSY